MRTQFKEMTDLQWQVMQENLPAQLFERKRQHDLRVIINAILWVLNVGGQWVSLRATPSCPYCCSYLPL
jgi:hypothetical protein